MRFMNYDLWVEHIATPYLPVVGLVHPDCLRVETLLAVVQSLQTGIRSEFDKSVRWGNDHDERLVDVWFEQGDDATILVTYRGDSEVAYIYTLRSERCETLIQQARNMGGAKIYTFAQKSGDKNTHIRHGFLGQTKKLTGISPDVRQIRRDEPELVELLALDNGKEMAGLAFLASQIAVRDDIGLTLGYFFQGKLVGVIGPLGVGMDALGRKYLLPPYFGIHESMRGKGAGRELWDAAMNYASEQGAEYVLVQAEDGAPSERFYRSNNLLYVGSSAVSLIDSL